MGNKTLRFFLIAPLLSMPTHRPLFLTLHKWKYVPVTLCRQAKVLYLSVQATNLILRNGDNSLLYPAAYLNNVVLRLKKTSFNLLYNKKILSITYKWHIDMFCNMSLATPPLSPVCIFIRLTNKCSFTCSSKFRHVVIRSSTNGIWLETFHSSCLKEKAWYVFLFFFIIHHF